MNIFFSIIDFRQKKNRGINQGALKAINGDSHSHPWNPLLRYLNLLILSMTIGWTVIIHMEIPVLPFDDAYITFRYIQNLLDGRGLVYNPGQWVFGSSSPLYLFWLTLFKFFFPDWAIPHLAVRFNALPFALAGLAVYFLIQKYTGHFLAALLGSCSFLTNPYLLSISGGGMETFLFISLWLLTLLVMADRRPLWTGLLSGLALLARPEGILILPLIMLIFRNRPKAFILAGLAFSSILLPWIIFSWWYYGNPIPLSLIAKARPLYPLPWGEALLRINSWMKAWVTGTGFIPTVNLLWQSLITWMFIIVTSAYTIIISRRGNGSGWQGVTLFWLILFFYGITNPLFFSWYWPNIFVPALILMVSGLYLLGQGLIAGYQKAGRKIGGILWVLGVGWILYASLVPNLIPAGLKKTGLNAATLFISSDSSRSRIFAYEQAAHILNRKALLSDTVASPEVGALGFSFKGFMYDACGLVSPEAIPFLPVPDDQRERPERGAISIGFTKRVNPDWVVTMPVFAGKSLFRSEWFTKEYFLFKAVPLLFPVWGDTEVHIYKKRKP